MSSSHDRRGFLKRVAAAGAAVGLADQSFLAGLPPVLAADLQPLPGAVPLHAEIEPLVRLLEDTPRNRLLEEVAQRMDVSMDQLDSLAREASSVVHMGSYCTVFTKTEILAHLRAGKKIPEIVAGLIESVVKRIIEMNPLTGEVVVTGGVVANNPILAEMLARHLGHPVHILPHAQLAGALGAALFAAEEANQ